jgi:hypothetical protein
MVVAAVEACFAVVGLHLLDLLSSLDFAKQKSWRIDKCQCSLFIHLIPVCTIERLMIE